MACAMSTLCNVLLLFSNVLTQALYASYIINNSHAFENKIGDSPLIILTSSSNFIIFLILAKGKECSLNFSGSFGRLIISFLISSNFLFKISEYILSKFYLR